MLRGLTGDTEKTGGIDTATKKGKTKDTVLYAENEGTELKTVDDRGPGIAIMLDVKDIVKHEKNGKGSVIIFGTLRTRAGEKIGTVNLNLNNLNTDSVKSISTMLGGPLAMGTPLVAELGIAKGATLDQWNKETKDGAEKAP